MHTVIKAALLPQIAQFVSNEEPRYYLKGAYIAPCESGLGVRLVATDGHVMGLLHSDDGRTESANIWPLAKELLVACASKPKDSRPRYVVITGNGPTYEIAVIESDGTDIAEVLGNPILTHYRGFITPIDGTFPDYERVIPSCDTPTEYEVPGAYNPEFMAKFAVVAKYGEDGEKQRAPRPVMVHGNSNNPAIVKIGGRPDFLGVMMPMRDDSDKLPAKPSWLSKPSQVMAAE
jgi:DNA polymerase III sliding clamp (beta) subunit (PCNA family)